MLSRKRKKCPFIRIFLFTSTIICERQNANIERERNGALLMEYWYKPLQEKSVFECRKSLAGPRSPPRCLTKLFFYYDDYYTNLSVFFHSSVSTQTLVFLYKLMAVCTMMKQDRNWQGGFFILLFPNYKAERQVPR